CAASMSRTRSQFGQTSVPPPSRQMVSITVVAQAAGRDYAGTTFIVNGKIYQVGRSRRVSRHSIPRRRQTASTPGSAGPVPADFAGFTFLAETKTDPFDPVPDLQSLARFIPLRASRESEGV